MSALTAARATVQMAGEPVVPSGLNFPIKSNTTIYEGSIVVLNTAGTAEPGTTATGKKCVGRACATVANPSGGSKTIDVEQGVFWFANGDSIAVTDIGALAYIKDDQTVTVGNTSQSIAGTIYKVDTTKGVAVHMQLSAPVDATALQAAIDAETDFEADLASTSTGEGAAMIGIEDAAGYYGAATVEAALVELTEEPIFSYSSQVTLSTVANSDVVAAVKPGFKCKIIAVSFTPTIAVSTALKLATLTPKINSTAVTGGVVALTSANCGTKGTLVAGTTVTAANAVIATDQINVVASSVTAFVEGEGMINILFGRA